VQLPGLQLLGLGRQLPRRATPCGDGAKPFFGQTYHLGRVYATCNRQYGIVGAVMFVKEGLHFMQLSTLYLGYILPDGGPAVGVHLVHQWTEFQPHIAIRLVEVTLFELFYHHLALHFEAAFAEIEPEHAVAFEPKGRLEIVGRKAEVIVGDIVIGKCVVFGANALGNRIVIGYVGRAAKHEVFKEVSEAGAAFVFVACPHIVE